MSDSLRQQRTIARAVSVSGFGFWSGQDVRVEFCPAEPDSGLVFVRSDLGGRRVAAVGDHRIEMPRRTTLAAGEVRVEMVEHILAALAGLQIDNCEVRANGAEMPGCDGSSLPFVTALQQAGICEQPALRARWVVSQPTRVGDDQCWVEARPASQDGLSLEYHLDYGSDSPIGRQSLRIQVTPEAFCRELAPARTFLLQQEAQWLRGQGLGGRVTCRDVLVFDEHGPRDNTLRFENECVRHKTLDMVGDLALAGCDLAGHIVAYRSGHRLNAELVRTLLNPDREHSWQFMSPTTQ